jgi:hypothetical protein
MDNLLQSYHGTQTTNPQVGGVSNSQTKMNLQKRDSGHG